MFIDKKMEAHRGKIIGPRAYKKQGPEPVLESRTKSKIHALKSYAYRIN